MSAGATGGKIWVTGAGGLLGNCFGRLLGGRYPRAHVIGLTRGMLDLTESDQVARRFREDAPALVIHCAALSRSPECQAKPDKARLLNVEVTRTLAALCIQTQMVLISTDLVFDGLKGDYHESDPVNPQSYYGETKLEAERIVLQHPGHLVIRTSLIAGQSPTGDRAFNEQYRRTWARGETLRLFTDEFRSPIHVETLTNAILDLLTASQSGLFHVAGADKMSRFDAGRLLAERCLELHPRIESAVLAEYRGAPRPPDTSLNCDRAQKHLGSKLPGLAEFLDANPRAFY